MFGDKNIVVLRGSALHSTVQARKAGLFSSLALPDRVQRENFRKTKITSVMSLMFAVCRLPLHRGEHVERRGQIWDI